MKFAVAKAVITPERPVFMHGFGARTKKSEGELDPLYMRTALLLANRPLLIVTIDALGSDRSFILGVKDALRRRFGLEHEEVLINFSHTHHSVFLTGIDKATRRGGYSMGQDRWPEIEDELDYAEDEAYYLRIRDMLLDMVDGCYGRAMEGTLSIARATSEFAVSRRRPRPDGSVDWAPYWEGDINKDLHVLKLEDTLGVVRGVLYAYGCHTTGMGADNYKFSNDFAAAATALVEEAYPESVGMFLQGCAGELKPRPLAVDDDFAGADEAGIREVGAVLGREVVGVLQGGGFRTIECRLKAEQRDPLLYTEQTPVSFYEAIAGDPARNAFYRNSAKRTIRAIHDGNIKDRLPFYICVWELDDRTRIVAMEGEVSTEYAMQIKRLFNRENEEMIVLGYTNGVYSYVPTRKMLGEGGYEAENNYFFGLRGPYVPEIEDIIVGQVARALRRLEEAELVYR